MRTGIMEMNRNGLHLAPPHVGARQDTYLRPVASNETHIIVIDGQMAQTAGVTLPQLENGAVATRIIGGVPRRDVSPAFGTIR